MTGGALQNRSMMPAVPMFMGAGQRVQKRCGKRKKQDPAALLNTLAVNISTLAKTVLVAVRISSSAILRCAQELFSTPLCWRRILAAKPIDKCITVVLQESILIPLSLSPCLRHQA